MSLAVLTWSTSSPTRGKLRFGRGHGLQVIQVVMICSVERRISEEDEGLMFDSRVAKKV